MGRCSTCKHWVKENGNDDVFRECHGIVDSNSTTGKDHAAYTWDYEGYSSGITTRGDFGCVLHEPREVEGWKIAEA